MNKTHAVLKCMLFKAVKRNPVPLIVWVRHTPEERRSTQKRLLPVLLVAYQLGFAYGEIVKLTWDRVDLKCGCISLRAQDTQNKMARKVRLTPELAAVFRDLYKVPEGAGQDREFSVSRYAPLRCYDDATGRGARDNGDGDRRT